MDELIDFDRLFPILTDEIKNLEENTNFEQLMRQLASNDSDTCNKLTNDFYQNRMLKIRQNVDSECSKILGPVWDDLLK